MNVISRPAIDTAIARDLECAQWLNAWWQRARHQLWIILHDVRRTYPQTDQAGSCLVFNATGGRRLIVGVRYATETTSGTLFVKHCLAHAEYDKGKLEKGLLL